MANSFLETKGFKKFMAMAYGLGASIVIIGALFKILHLEGANFMLMVGMGVEAFIFAISAFEPLGHEWDWSLVYPELSKGEGSGSTGTVSQQLDEMLSDANVGPEVIASLGTGLNKLSENVEHMADLSSASVATEAYAVNVQNANEKLNDMNNSYGRAIEALESLATSTGSYSETAEAFKASSRNLENVNNSLAAFDANIQSLNDVYGGMLSAMKGK